MSKGEKPLYSGSAGKSPALTSKSETQIQKGDKAMKWRTYNEHNICKRTGIIFATYFRTKREAVEHCKLHGGVVEKRLVDTWVQVD